LSKSKLNTHQEVEGNTGGPISSENLLKMA